MVWRWERGESGGVETRWVPVSMFQASYNKGLSCVMAIPREKGDIYNIVRVERTKLDK